MNDKLKEIVDHVDKATEKHNGHYTSKSELIKALWHVKFLAEESIEEKSA